MKASRTVHSNPKRFSVLSGAYPEGVLSFGSATPFTKAKIEVPSQSPVPSYLFFVDNIVVQLATPLPPHAPPLAFGGNFCTLQTWPAQAWADGSIFFWDNFADLTNLTTQAFYRLRHTPLKRIQSQPNS